MRPARTRSVTTGRTGRWWVSAAAVFLVTAGAACQPATVTEARDQLKRGGARTISLNLPVTFDSALIIDFLAEGSDTVVAGISGVKIDERFFQVPVIDSFVVPIGFDSNAFDFGDFEDAIRQATLNASQTRVVMTNPTNQPVTIDDFRWGVVELNPDGSVPTDGAGAPIYQTDGAGNPLVISVADAGDTLVTVAASAEDTLDVDTGPLVDGLADLVLDGRLGAVVLSGSAAGGVGFTILGARIDVVVLLDLTLPAVGVEFETSNTQAGAELDAADADEVAARLNLAAFTIIATNITPFAADVDIAFAEGALGDTDLFTFPGSVILSTVTLDPSMVDANGAVTVPVVDTIMIQLTGNQSRPLLADEFTARSRLRLRPAAVNGRAVLRPGDFIEFSASVAVSVNAGADQ